MLQRKRNFNYLFYCLLSYGFLPYLSAQSTLPHTNHTDTIHLDELNIHRENPTPVISFHLPKQLLESPSFSTFNLNGHSLQQINLSEKAFHCAEKTGRQLFAEIPGAMIYDMDGSGNQINLAIRGLDPHRSWEFNIRQNGLVMNSDMYGYPASHYSMPLEAVQSIEIIKGTAALQYGAQFGGLINYTLKVPSRKKIAYEGHHDGGSFGLISTYHSLSGTVGKFNYFSYIQYRQSNGFRQNGESQSSAFHTSINYNPNKQLLFKLELSNSQYTYHIPGPLGLSQFKSNPRQSTRNRNYFQPNIYLPGFTAQYTPNQNTTITLIISGIRGERNSVLFEGFADKMDTVNSATNTFANRSVDIDVFNSNTAELRLKHKFYVQNLANTLSLGLRGFNNLMWRRQLGRGTTGSDFDLTVIPNSFKRDLKFHSESIAFNVENLIQMTDRLSISPGFRYELGKTDAYGMISYSQTDSIPRKIQHEIPALGLAMEYRTKNNHGSINGGVSQAHRPVIFKDIIPGSALERTAYSLQDAKGYNAEVQYRNNLGRDQFNFTYSAGIYQTLYKNRMGNSVITDPVSQVNYIQKTNIGDSRTRGLEIFMKATYVAKIHREPKEIPTEFSLFNATAVQQAIYVKATAVSAGKNIDISGHQVEGVPKLICRTGLTIRKNQNQITLLHSYVSTQFSDALNTVAINNNGSIGQVPSYGLIDLQGVFIINKILKMRAGINNMLNKRYYTKRPTMYPGPGIWPSDGRGLYFGIEIKI